MNFRLSFARAHLRSKDLGMCATNLLFFSCVPLRKALHEPSARTTPPVPFSRTRLRKALPLLALMLGACASPLPLPVHDADLDLPRRVHVVQREPEQPDLDRLLVVQREGSASRWSLFDPMGVPLARQLLQNGRWQSDGLLPPNAQARGLFAELIFAWMARNRLDSAYGPGAWKEQTSNDGRRQRIYLREGSPLWTIEWPAPSTAQDTFMIAQRDGIRWWIAPLKEQP